MSFLPAIPLSAVPAYYGSGGIAVNLDGNLIASVVSGRDSVYIEETIE